MITVDEFIEIASAVRQRPLNEAQQESLRHSGDRNLLIVAGPGSGKTTVLVLRALRHVFVDGQLPEHLLITTFTKKAAKELRTRWLDWGTAVLSHLQQSGVDETRLRRVDLNRCRIDTLDSIVQQALSENRLPGEIAPEVIEDATANLILKRRAFSRAYTNNQAVLDPLLARYTFDGRPPKNRGDALRVIRILCDRMIQDQVNLTSYAAGGAGERAVVEIAQAYWQRLSDTGLLDFSTLERRFLERLRSATLGAWLAEITTLLIDEYQDTNPLQEAVYFELISSGIRQVTVVGDDDQAMYRFRGGSVELFTQFATRCAQATGRNTRRLDMITNYRSTAEIVHFYNVYVRSDPQFAGARITPAKPEVISTVGAANFPVLGLFRQSAGQLASSLAEWLDDLIKLRRFSFSHQQQQYELTLRAENALGDFVFLGHTVDEAAFQGFGQNTEGLRFPGLVRQEMEQRGHHVFNPRGRSLRAIPRVQQLLGLLLLTLDPDSQFTSSQNEFNITAEARFYVDQWRIAGQNLIDQNLVIRGNSALRDFVSRWQRASRGNQEFDESDWPILELLFKLVAWIPDFQNDPEHQVWLEAVTRAITSAAIDSPYRMLIHQRSEHRIRSRQSIVRDGLVPIAENEVDVDEDIMLNVPRSYLQLMTIHQSKGLEFPLVIVDVASAFTSNHHTQAFRRFPRAPSNVTQLEDDLEQHIPSALRSARSALDRTFDDLVRLYYVSYSRPQSVLLLVGCEQCLRYGTGSNLTGAIPHIGMGWLRDKSWPWRQPRPGRGTPVVVEPPFLQI